MIAEALLGAALIAAGVSAARGLGRDPDPDHDHDHDLHTTRTRTGRMRGGRRHAAGYPAAWRRQTRDSRLVKAWNASGAPRTEETYLGDALADLGGRITGRVARRGARLTRSGARATTCRAETRWARKTPDRRTTPLFQRLPNPGGKPASKPDPADTGRPAPPDPAGTGSSGSGSSGSSGAGSAGTGGGAGGSPDPAPHPDPGAGRTRASSSPDSSAGGSAMPDPKPHRHGRRPSSSGAAAPVPPQFAAIAAAISDYEPASDAELFQFVEGTAAGVLALAEALTSLYETCTTVTGLDQSAMGGLMVASESLAESGRDIAEANNQAAQVYAPVMGFVEGGGVMPHDGRFFTGDAA